MSSARYRWVMTCLIFGLPLHLLVSTMVNLSLLLTRYLCMFSSCVQTISVLPPHLVHQGGQSCSASDSFIPNLITLSMPTLSQHHHFHYSHLTNMRVFDRPTLNPYNMVGHHFIKPTFKAWWYIPIRQDTVCELSFHPLRSTTMRNIIINLPIVLNYWPQRHETFLSFR